MNIVDLILKKKTRQKINEKEFDFFIKGVLDNSIKDYQISAFMMAICFNGLDDDESFYLTKAMTLNGETINFDEIKDTIVDKHSTGGIGDKVSLILVPLLASMNINVAKMSGKGLGFTGGTIDKLHSIGIKTELKDKEYIDLLKKEHMFFISQSEKIAPADKILYSIRDTSGTIDNISLIAASIMSKKIATNADLIYLDVKVGDGAFFKTIKEARKFSKLCISIGKKFNKKVIAHLTNMEKPLGRAIGNLIEIKESLDFLSRKNEPSNLKDLIYSFASDILIDLSKAKDKQEAYKLIDKTINDKSAFNKFSNWSKLQGCKLDLNKIDEIYNPKYKIEILSEQNGYLEFISNELFGYSLIDIKAGRINKEDKLDYLSGIYLNKICGDKVSVNDVILTVYSSTPISDKVIESLKNNILYTNKPKKASKEILEVIR
ncbi:thymidine phosphorylase [Malacoplasma iowae]|uniref:Thymidine phosphorylase n=1 Tax=Malacoplasma iowae 695 TaxID=1048830 RepID=A0A6P1LF37_MALIO|nr:thymidine phosphorylase [Malacoplasma iowae]VEU61909.1 Thymidine phosphorylase [Mycoplasmopsis fermentans]EGZ31092.1 thymidine phosphorylase [Malacoplasma iowae 695]QHG90068.1 thymidine phosphorylase [Malacoplasma iowae 695]WPL36199.1 thymidine phosphorylase [Malacoplasma iowae]VEU70843.1 Thymidine phosphorylase [Malacoplasma iowae]